MSLLCSCLKDERKKEEQVLGDTGDYRKHQSFGLPRSPASLALLSFPPAIESACSHVLPKLDLRFYPALSTAAGKNCKGKAIEPSNYYCSIRGLSSEPPN